MPVDAQVQVILDQLSQVERPLATLTPADLRNAYAAMAQAMRTARHEVPAEDLKIEGRDGPIPIRVYRPEGAGLPVILYLHGGGWTIGDLETHDALCRELAVRVPAVVVNVDYRLAPEHKFPAALHDALDALAWVGASADRLGADVSRLALAGDSAGGNLAAVLARHARDAGPAIAFQLLAYPVTDATRSSGSYVENGAGYFLTAEDIEWFIGHYLPDGADPADPDISPLFASDLSGVAPGLVITAEYDPLRDEGEAYAERLRAEGVNMATRRYDGMIHGFFSMGAFVEAAQGAVDDAVVVLQAALR